ncbi:MAG: ABC transporter ATP-binding protein [Aerococcus sp.]|nr:ABC transporter ATP-binding protein [Aerococcus sp.]
MFLTVKQLTKRYGKQVAIDKVSFSVAEGKLLCILGPSGCGKSTVLRAIAGFITSEGQIQLAKRELSGIPVEEREISMVFQSLGLFPHLNVFDNISYGLKFQPLSKAKRQEKVSAMLERLDLKGFGERSIQSLSGGQQQRVALGRALIVNPKLLLLDEPLSSLDVQLQQTMRREIRQFQQTFGITTIFVTHNQDEAFEIADEVLVMNHGRVEQQGTAKALYEHPQTPFVASFIGKSSPVEGGYARPEDIKLHQGTTAATVTALIFKGTWSEVYLQTAYGELMTVTNTPETFHVGEQIQIQLTRRDYENS